MNRLNVRMPWPWPQALAALAIILAVVAAEDSSSQANAADPPTAGTGTGTERSASIEWLLGFVDWIATTGLLGIVYYILFLAVAVVISLPVTILETIPGFLFGWKMGLFVAFCGKNLGNLVSIVLGKTLLRDYVLTTITPKYRTFRVVQQFARTNGLVALIIFRGLVFAPLAVKNYGLAVLDIDVLHIMIAAIFTGLPYAVWWTYLGSTAKNLVQILDGQDIASPFESIKSNPVGLGSLVAVGGVACYYVITDAKAKWSRAERALEEEDRKAKLK